MSYVNLLTHIVISTYQREMSLDTRYADNLYRYIAGYSQNMKCKLLAIGGIPNHIHLLIDINPQICITDFVRELKKAASKWIKSSSFFPAYNGWSEGYFASSVSFGHKQNVIDYINNQREHHLNLHYEDEFNRLILKNGLVDKYRQLGEMSGE